MSTPAQAAPGTATEYHVTTRVTARRRATPDQRRRRALIVTAGVTLGSLGLLVDLLLVGHTTGEEQLLPVDRHGDRDRSTALTMAAVPGSAPAASGSRR